MARSASDEAYIIGLCDEVLKATASRQHRFDFLRGDPNKKGRCAMLPVDAYYQCRRLVIEYRERQHTETVEHWDRKDTVSQCSRGEQRRRYDKRRESCIPCQGLRLVILDYSMFGYDSRKRLLRSPQADLEVVKAHLDGLLLEVQQGATKARNR